MLKKIIHCFFILIFCFVFDLKFAFGFIKRPSITFIVGEDKDKDNLYYTQAGFYYSHNLQDKTDFLERSLHSLIEIRDYLERVSLQNRVSWGLINIVAHSNEWTGLSIPILPKGQRATASSLKQAIDKKIFNPLPDSVVDSNTEIRVQGCALGRDFEFLKVLSTAYGGDDFQKPVVRSCRYFICYETKMVNGNIVDCVQYLADYWTAFYRKGYRPCDIKLSRQLKLRYPDIKVNWRQALKRKKPRFLGDTFYYTYNVPIKWIVVYPDQESCPDMSLKSDQDKWLHEQKDLYEYIDSFGISFKDFLWQIKNIKYGMPDKTLKPGIKASGKSTIVCILKALTTKDPLSDNQTIPLKPSLIDPLYYGTVDSKDHLAFKNKNKWDY